MASKGKERENFFRINVLVVDHIKNALLDMLKYYLCQKNMSFEEFIDEHIADIKYLRKSKILYTHEVDKFIVDDKAISDIPVDKLEVTLVRRLVDNLCPDLFMDAGCKTLQDFLKKNQHDIYHLFKYDQRCCQCNDRYTVPVGEQLLKENEYKNMFDSSPCTNCTGAVCSGFTCKNTEYIRLDYGTRCTVFEHFSRIFKAVQNLKKIRDDAHGHIEADEIPDDDYDGYYNAIKTNILVLAKHCGKEKDTLQALDDVQERSLDETLCIQYKISLSEDIKRDIELMEVIGENSQKLQENIQKIEKHLQKLREQMENMNLNKDVGATFETQTLQDTNISISTPSSGNQSSVYEISVKNQTNVYSRTQQHQLDRRSLENQNLQTLNNDIPSTSTQPPILGIQILMNQTNNIERNSLERDHRQQVAVVESGGLMRNSEPQNLHSSVNPTDDQAGAMTSCSPESSSNNISIGNDQRGQGYQSSIGTDAEPNSSVNNERAHDREKKRDIYDGVVLHAEDDRDAAIEFIRNMKRENPDLNMKITLFDNLDPGTSKLGSPAKCFDSCRYVFVFVTHNFVNADLERFLSESATIETLTSREKKARLIPVKADKTNLSALAPLKPLNYDNYLKAKKSQQVPDQHFIKCFRDLITSGRQKYLVN